MMMHVRAHVWSAVHVNVSSKGELMDIFADRNLLKSADF